ncbi:MAG: AAA family ATPase [Planctomycetaceae bacterium]|nr:AAA family ATPase [Planctomycetaceae bacterium]
MIVDQLFNKRSDGSSAERTDLSREFIPRPPQNLRESGLTEGIIEALTLKFLLNRTNATGMEIARQLKLPFKMMEEELRRMKREQFIAHRNSSQMHDYVYELTPNGYELAHRLSKISTYFGSSPVPFSSYVDSVNRQKLDGTGVTPEKLKSVLRGLSIQPEFFQQVGQAIRAARGLFLFGSPGNGKTTIAERICQSFGPRIWVPRTLLVDGELIRVYDPTVHREIAVKAEAPIDHRWVCIERPTVVAGGELTLENLELTKIGDTGVVEAPLQLKSNCGVLVIDDFGRQRCSPTDLLNRWIVPLEMKVDYLNLPSGKKLKTPFEQMIVFSTNLKPRELVDEAFLRRIPYKVEARNPNPTEFLRLLQSTATAMQIQYDDAHGKYMLSKYFGPDLRELRYCHARDLMLQVKNACEFQGRPPAFEPDIVDQAIRNYFVDME